MPLLTYHSTLPQDLWDIVQSFIDVMHGLLWYLTAFLASSTYFPNGGVVTPTHAQYLLGLGEPLHSIPSLLRKANRKVYSHRNRGHNRVNHLYS
jgi:hypothetical protein